MTCESAITLVGFRDRPGKSGAPRSRLPGHHRRRCGPKLEKLEHPQVASGGRAQPAACEVAHCIRAFLHDGIMLSTPERHLDIYREGLQQCFNFHWTPPITGLLIPVAADIRPVQVVAEFSAPGQNWAECCADE